MPSVNKLYSELKGQGFEVRAISFRENPALVRRTVQERGYTAPVLIDESGDVTGRLYGVFGPPTVYILDRQGRLLARISGPGPWASEGARGFIKALLETP